MSRSLLDDVEILPGRRHEDDRGWLHVAVGASQLPAGSELREVYAVHAAVPGARRGDHLHRHCDEWFTVVQGCADLLLADPAGRGTRSIRLCAEAARTVRVPAGLAHCLVNAGPGPMTALACANREHEPSDVVPFFVAAPEPV